MFLRRLGPDPHANGAQTIALKGCPDILELEKRQFRQVPGFQNQLVAAKKAVP